MNDQDFTQAFSQFRDKDMEDSLREIVKERIRRIEIMVHYTDNQLEFLSKTKMILDKMKMNFYQVDQDMSDMKKIKEYDVTSKHIKSMCKQLAEIENLLDL